MNTHQKRIHKGNMKATVGDREDVPPTLCPPTADAFACVPAHVKHIGAAVSSKSQRIGDGRPVAENSLILLLEAAP
jgi:hypothetical protein